MSPEQASGIDIDHRADVYAVGVIMYELLTGRVPFSGKTFMAILQSHMFDSPRPPSQVSPYGDIPEDAEAVILKALQKDRDFRFQSMRELIGAIEKVGTGAPAVAVVDERPTLPSQGAMQYLGTGPNDALYPEKPTEFGEAPRSTTQPMEPQRRGGGILIGAALTVLALAGGVGAYLALAPDPDPAPVVAASNAPHPEPVQLVVPSPTPTPTPTEAPKIQLSISTPVVAQVRDPRDGSIFGVTNGDPIEFERGDEPVRVVLSAEGYEDLEVEFTPSANLQLEKLLEARKPGKGGGKGGKKGGGKGGKKGGGKGGKPDTTKEPSKEPADGGKPPKADDGKAAYESPDLLNPFGKKKKP
jgi:serine/threonine-protein kinase